MGTISSTVVHELGHLVVYKKTSLLHPFGDGRFYYSDKRFEGEIGPFASAHEAVDHWTNYIMPDANERIRNQNEVKFRLNGYEMIEDQPAGTPVVVEEEWPNNVIYVDFVAKRRRF